MSITDERLLTRLKTEKLPPIPHTYNEFGEMVFPSINPIAQESDIWLAEALLDIALPPFLKRLYLEVGNGGFGPGRGLAQLLTPDNAGPWAPYEEGTDSIAHTTLLFKKWGEWPENLLYLASGGCTVYYCLDIVDPLHPIIHIDQITYIATVAPSLQAWLEMWLNGERRW